MAIFFPVRTSFDPMYMGISCSVLLSAARAFFWASLSFVPGAYDSTGSFAGAVHQVGLDEAVEFAVHDGLDIADLKVRAMVFDHLIGMEDIAADL
jgi:hypothetical protein